MATNKKSPNAFQHPLRPHQGAKAAGGAEKTDSGHGKWPPEAQQQKLGKAEVSG